MKERNRKTQTTTAEPELTRRNFLKLGIGALGGLAVLELGGAGLVFLQPRTLEGEFGGMVVAGSADSFPPGTVTHFPDARFYLIRAQDGGFLAVYQRCTHLGCTVAWQPGDNRFFCPCHASSFDFHGNVENPPAPRALDTFPVSIEDGMVQVDTARAQSRDRFTSDQLAYAG